MEAKVAICRRKSLEITSYQKNDAKICGKTFADEQMMNKRLDSFPSLKELIVMKFWEVSKTVDVECERVLSGLELSRVV